MKHRGMTAGFLLVIMIIAGVLVSASGGIAGEWQIATVTAGQNTNLEMSPFKGPSTAPVVITVFSDFQ